MLILGILSFFQIIFIPGYLTLKISKIKPNGIIQLFLYSFALSFLFNYIFVLISTTLGIYTTLFTRFFIVFELIALLYFCFKDKILSKSVNRTIYLISKKNRKSSGFQLTLHSIIIILLIISLSIFFANLGSIFDYGDDVASWNKWAKEWAENHFPTNSYEYPQILSANWSISYVLLGTNEIQFFAKAVMPLFFLANLLIFCYLIYTLKLRYFIFGFIIYFILGLQFHNHYILSGYADLPVSFFCFLAIITLWDFHRYNFSIKRLFLILCFITISVNTKHTAFYIAFLMGIYIIYYFYKNYNQLEKSDILKIIFTLLILGIIAVGWYIKKFFDIFYFKTDILVLKNVMNGTAIPIEMNYFFRFINAIKLLPALIYLITPLILLSVFNKDVRKITLSISFVFTIIWAFISSYDLRNLSLALPFYALTASAGFEILVNKFHYSRHKQYEFVKYYFCKKINIIKIYFSIFIFIIISSLLILYFFKNEILNFLSIYTNRSVENYRINYIYNFLQSFLAFCLILSIVYFILSRWKIKSYIIFIIISAFVVFLNFSLFSEKNIRNEQEKKDKLIVTPQLNLMLYDYIEKYKIKGKIGNNYGVLELLPLLKNHSIFINQYTSVSLIDSLLNYNEVNYLLLRFDIPIDEKTNFYLQNLQKNKKLEIIFQYENLYIFYKINK